MVIMFRITAISTGSVEYLLKGSGCTHQDPLKQVLEGPENAPNDPEHPQTEGSSGKGGGKSLPVDYHLAAQRRGEEPGRWYGKGLEFLEMTEGTVASEDAVRRVFGQLKHPHKDQQLGSKPREFKDYRTRLAEALEREPGATQERVAAIKREVKADGRSARAYYDFTFSPPKSLSVYYAALIAAGAHDEAAKLRKTHDDAVKAAISYMETHAAYVRSGRHTTAKSGRSVGAYERAKGFAVVLFPHSVNRENEPQLHCHGGVLNRAETESDNRIRALDGKGFAPVKEGADSIYLRNLEAGTNRDHGLEWGLRGDGKAREILGIDPLLCEEGSTRTRQTLDEIESEIDKYVQRTGRQPSAATRKEIARLAALHTRKPKTAESGPGAIATWAEPRADRLAAMTEQVDKAAANVRATQHPDLALLPDQQDRRAIIEAAVEEIQAQYSTWTVGNLMAAIDRQMVTPPCPIEELPDYIETMAKEALAAGNDYGILTITAPDLIDTPAQLQRPDDGRLKYRPHIDEEYVTREHLDTEQQLVIGSRQLSTPGLDELSVEQLAALNAFLEAPAPGKKEPRLSADQRAAVLGVMTSGRAGDVLIGPAGAGKSYTMATLEQAWTEHFGGRVLGLATSQRATDVLGEEGLEALNTTQFLRRFTADPRTGEVRDQVQPGDLFIIDEAGMSSTRELARIAEIVWAAGGKILFTGDYQQLGSVGAGGMLAYLANENGSYELETVRRFHAEWERQASLGLRLGDSDVVRQYATHGRLVGGTIEDMREAAVRGFLADTIAGKDSLLIVGENEEAADLSGKIQQQLLDLDRLGDEVAALSDGNTARIGDVIQARRNNYQLQVDGGRGMVVNREVYVVRGVDERGRLIAETKDGAIAYLTDNYLAKYAVLGYASTVHAAQGRTVDTGHSVLPEGTSREDAYPALTRGRECNTAYLVTRREPEEHAPEPMHIDPSRALGNILDNSRPPMAAQLARRESDEEIHSLAWIGAIWDLEARERAKYRYDQTIKAVLSREEAKKLWLDPNYRQFISAVRAAELAGHDADDVIQKAVATRELETAKSVADVLCYRLHQVVLPGRTPEQFVDPRNWTTFAPPVDAAVGQWLQEMAVLASDRQAELGEDAAEQLPDWAIEHLGLPPVEPDQRAEWVHRAGIAAAYRELVGVREEQVSLGEAPPEDDEFRRALWQQAYSALGRPGDAMDFATATNAELHQMRLHWEREKTWAPAYVADEMENSYRLAEEYRYDAVLFDAHLQTLEPGSREYAETLAQTERAERLAADFAERARRCESINAAREHWYETTEDARVRERLAREELSRRGVDLRKAEAEAAAEAEQPREIQLPLFRVLRDTSDKQAERPDQEVDAGASSERQVDERQVDEQQVDDRQVDDDQGPDLSSDDQTPLWQRWRDWFAGDRNRSTGDPEAERAAAAAVDEAIERAEATDRRRDEQLAAEPDRVDENQLALFELPDADRVGAQPMAIESLAKQRTQRRHGTGQPEGLSLAEASAQARTAELISLNREATAKAEAEKRQQAAEQAREDDRSRRDRASELQTIRDREQSRLREQARERAEQERNRNAPTLERALQPRHNPPSRRDHYHPGRDGFER